VGSLEIWDTMKLVLTLLVVAETNHGRHGGRRLCAWRPVCHDV